LAEEIQVLHRAHAHVEAVLFGENANRGAHLRALSDDIVSVDARPTAGREKKRCQHADSGGLTRAVLPKQGQNLTGTHRQRDAIHRPEIGEPLA
jgi:hypothetical protein